MEALNSIFMRTYNARLLKFSGWVFSNPQRVGFVFGVMFCLTCVVSGFTLGVIVSQYLAWF